jgi:hypothetical protein
LGVSAISRCGGFRSGLWALWCETSCPSAEPSFSRLSPNRKAAQGNLGAIQAGLGKTQEAADHFCQYIRQFDSLEHGKSNLTRVFKDANPNVKAAINMTLANCN